MEEELNISEEYKQWFNRGYNLRKTMPQIFQGMKIPENEPSSKMRAFDAGVKQFESEYGVEREALRQQLRSRSDRGQNQNRDR